MSSPASALPAVPLDVRFEATVPVLEIPSDMDFNVLREWIRGAVPPHLEAIAGRTCRADIGERDIKLFDLRRLLHLLRDEFGLQITGLYVRPEAIHRYAERELKLKLFLPTHPTQKSIVGEDNDNTAPTTEASPPAELDPVEDPTDEITFDTLDATRAKPYIMGEENSGGDLGRRTLVMHRTIRSGALIRFDGDVTLFGDVNPGAQIVASGNILVMGTLKGMAHAGATGDEDAFILALSLQATQLRVARKIATLPGHRPSAPEVARITGGADVANSGQITIEPYTGKVGR